MRGLLRNEYYSMKRLMLLYAAVLAFYFILGFLIRGSSNRGVPLGLPLYADLFGVVLVIYSFSYEEKSGWSRLVNTLPVSRGKIVRGEISLFPDRCAHGGRGGAGILEPVQYPGGNSRYGSLVVLPHGSGRGGGPSGGPASPDVPSGSGKGTADGGGCFSSS